MIVLEFDDGLANGDGAGLEALPLVDAHAQAVAALPKLLDAAKQEVAAAAAAPSVG